MNTCPVMVLSMVHGYRAIYELLRQAFNMANTLGTWLCATNRILHGFPFFIMRVNVLTSIPKYEVDSLRRHMCATRAGLPSNLAYVHHDDLTHVEGFTLEHQDAGY